MDFMKRRVAAATNPRGLTGRLSDALEGADVFIGLSVPGILTVPDLKRMRRDPIVFAMADPAPEIQPEDAARALAACVSRSELSEESIIPSVFNKSVAPAVAEGVARAAYQTGTPRRRRRGERALGP
jgi:malate dehydrogenase (oxaloacetate-decarboxylating)